MQTPLRKEIQSKHELRKVMKKLATPLRKEIQNAPALNKVMKSMPTPIRKAIQKKPELKATKKKLATPLRKQIQEKPGLRATKKKLATPLRKQIQEKPGLRATKKKLATPLRKQIQEKPGLRVTKKKLATPIRQGIKKGVALRVTKKKLQTPLRKEIKEGVKLRKTKPTLATPLREEIKSKPQLRENKKRMRQDLQNEIVEGRALQSKFKDLPKLPAELKTEVAEGKVLKKTLKSAPTPFKNEIKEGVKLRETKRKMRQSLQSEIISGTELRKTKRSAPTPLRKEIKEGKELRKTKKTAPTPFRKEIKKGVQLRQTKKKLDSAIQNEIKEGIALKKTKKTAPTPFRKEIKKGVRLRQTKRKLDSAIQNEIKEGIALKKTKKTAPTPFRKEIKKGVKLRQTKRKLDPAVQNEIKQGTALKKTKIAAPTPFRNEIKKGVKLRQTKKKLNESLQKEIKGGKELNKTKRIAPTPFRNEVKKGIKLRATKKRMSMSLQSQIRAGASLIPLMRKSLKTPIRAEIRAGANLRRTVKRIGTPLKKQIEARRKSLRSAAREPIEESIEPVVEAEVIQALEPQNTKRNILKAKRRLGNKAKVMPSVVPEIPRRLSEKIEKPAKKRVCRRSTPKKIAELRDQFEFVDPYEEEHDTEEAEESIPMSAEEPGTMSPVIEVQAVKNTPASFLSKLSFSDTLLCETSFEEENAAEEFGALCKIPSLAQAEPADDTSDIVNEVVVVAKETMIENSPVEAKNGDEVDGDFGTSQLFKTPKEVKRSGAVEEHFGTKRLFKTPREPKSSQAVEEHFGIKRLMTTPKERATGDTMVMKNFGLKRLMATPTDHSEKTDRYSIEIGALPSMFREGNDRRQEPVDEMQLQDLFVEIEPCCLQEAPVADGKMGDEAKAECIPESKVSEATEEPKIYDEACEVAKQVAEEIQEVVVVQETRKTRRTTRGGMQKVTEIVAEVKPARQTRRGKKAKVAEPIDVKVIEEECEVVEQNVQVDAAKSEEVISSVLPDEAAEQVETVVVEEECGNKAVDKIIEDNVAKIAEEATASILPEEVEPKPCCGQEVVVNDGSVESETKAESSPMPINEVESTVEPAMTEDAHEVAKQDVEETPDVVSVKEARKTRRTTRGGVQKTVEEVKPARQTRRGRKAKVAEPMGIMFIEEECPHEDSEQNVQADAAKSAEATTSVLPEEADAEAVVSKPVRQTRRGRKVKAAKQIEEIATEVGGHKEPEMVVEDNTGKKEELTAEVMTDEIEAEPVALKPVRQTRRGKKGKAAEKIEEIASEVEGHKEPEMVVEDNTGKKEEPTAEVMADEIGAEPVALKPVRQTRRGKKGKAAEQIEQVAIEEESPKEALELIIQGVACKIQEKAEIDMVSEEAIVEPVVSKPLRQSRRGRKGKAVQPVEEVTVDKEISNEDSAAKQGEEKPDVASENVMSKPARRTRRGKQDEISQPMDNAANEIESTSEVPSGRRATRGKKAAAPEKPAARRGKRGTVAKTAPEPAEIISDVIPKLGDDKQESTEKDIACKPEQDSRPKRSRKSLEQVVQRISRKRSQIAAENKEASSEEEKSLEPNQVAKKRGGRRKRVKEDVPTGDEGHAAGVVKGVSVTPEKMQLKKIKLDAILEESASQIGTPMVDMAQVEEAAEKEEIVPVTKATRRATRGRKRGADATEQDDSVSLSQPPSKKRVSTRQTRSKRS
eukprot:Seg1724.8 transcript_id=Seg1724.8/GoldUCD/mRNA.D3Y31 product="hypothetical protein" protein_id=Seg1724.8/GoldUCD/D3Y31